MKQKTDFSDLVTKSHLNDVVKEIDENARKYRDQILTKLDGVMGELETIREDNTLGTYQTSELREQVTQHDKRITLLEKHQVKS